MATVFENSAVRAYELLAIEKLTADPHEAWSIAAPSFSASINVQKKPCPIATFSGLWNAGIIKGSNPRSSHQILRNAQYAVDAIRVLNEKPHLTKSQVWSRIPGTNGGAKAHDGQMDVLFALWGKGL